MDNTFDSLYFEGNELIAGIDESGVSDIAGPLVAACVILPKIRPDADDLSIFNVTDSKAIHEKYRKKHAEVIWSVATAIGIGEVSPEELDCIGKRRGTVLAMVRAVDACQTYSRRNVIPDILLIDGEFKLPFDIKQEAIKDGDTKSLCIASASVIAKVYRDDIMLKLHQSYPYYCWDKNKGHPCEPQFKGLDIHGIQTGVHRQRFWPFTPNEKSDEKVWYYRRNLWRQKTNEAKLKEILGSDKWTLKQPSSKQSKKSAVPQQVTKLEPNGQE